MSKLKNILLRVGKIGILAAVPLVVMFLGTFITMIFTIRGREVTVPNVVGIEQPQAERIMRRGNLQPVIAGSRFSADFPPGQVLQQMPEANSRVKAHKRVKLVISEGKPKVMVPRLVGLSVKEAAIVLNRSGLRMGLISRAHVLASPREQIIQQFPAPGATDLQTPYVNLLINLPSEDAAYLMPNLQGLRAADVSAFLGQNGFILRPPDYELSFTHPSGTIVAHYPEFGHPVSRGIPIALVVIR